MMDSPHLKEILYGRDDLILSVTDNRTCDTARADRIAILKEETKLKILAAWPEHRQRNAALGLLSEEETAALRDGIQALRDEYAAKEAQLLACETLPELDALYL